MAVAEARLARAPIPWPSRLRSFPLKQLSVSIFFVSNLVAIVVWSLPYKSAPKRCIDNIVSPYMQFTGMWQGWDMFAPDPLKDQIRVDATVTFPDGRAAAWEFPQMQKLGVFERYPKERYRKWSQDHVRMNEKRGLWGPTAKFVARQFAGSENVPIRIELYRYWKPVPPPDSAPAEPTWHRAIFCRTEVPLEPQP